MNIRKWTCELSIPEGDAHLVCVVKGPDGEHITSVTAHDFDHFEILLNTASAVAEHNGVVGELERMRKEAHDHTR